MAKSKLKPDDPRNQEYRNSGFKLWEIQRYARLKPVRALMDETHGEGKWGNDQVLEYMKTRQKVKKRQATIDSKSEKAKKEDFLTRVERRFKEYMEKYKDITPNDEQSIRQMCNFEELMAEVNIKLSSPDLMIDDLKKLGELAAKYSGEHRQLQTSLGITRTGRETEVDAANEIKRLVEGSREFIKKRGIELYCPRCRKTDDSPAYFIAGVIIFHFDTPAKFVWECPRCHSIVTSSREGVSHEEPEREDVIVTSLSDDATESDIVL